MAVGHLAGFYSAQLAFRSSAGYPMGVDSTPDSVSNGDIKSALKLTGTVSATAPSPTRELATFRGGQSILGQRALGTSDFGSFELTLSAYDESLVSYITKTAVESTKFGTSNTGTAHNVLNANIPQFHLILSTGFTDTTGTNKFINWFYPNVQIYPPGMAITQDGGVNPNPQAFTVVPSTSTRTTHGYLFSATSFGLQGNADVAYYVVSTYQLAVTTYIDDGSATSFAVGYRPATSDNDNSINVFTKNGTDNAANVAAFSTTTGATTHTAGSAADIWVATYGTEFVSV